MNKTKWIEKVLFCQFSRKGHKCIMPCATPPNWWECDIFSTTTAGFFNEFEIKTSGADFLQDFKKDKMPHWDSSQGIPWAQRVKEKKHSLLAATDTRGPSRYWFCTPAGLLTPEHIPEYAGHIEFPEVDYEKVSPFWYQCMEIKKQAPRLHNQKFEEKRLAVLKDRLVYRYQEMYFRRG